MLFRVDDGACDALGRGAVGTLAGHPGGLGSLLTCGCGHDDCPHKTPEGRIGHLWLDFAEDQLTEHKRAERGTLPVPEAEPGVCPTCAGSRVVQLEAQRNEHRLVVDVPELPPGATSLVIPHGMSPDAAPAYDAAAARHPALELPPYDAAGARLDDDTADFEVESGADYADDYEPEPLVPELIEVQCPLCKGTGVAPPPPPPMIPNNPLPFRAGIRADLVELVYDRVDGVGAVGGYGA